LALGTAAKAAAAARAIPPLAASRRDVLKIVIVETSGNWIVAGKGGGTARQFANANPARHAAIEIWFVDAPVAS
jgi:hypothetical protein